jgi:hypothetical protein
LGYADAEDWYCKSVRASLAGQPSAKADFKALPEVESVEQEERVDPGIKATILRVGERFTKECKVSRPYLLLNVEPRMVARARECFTARERMAARAKAEWKKDTDGPKELQELPPLMDGSNCRFAVHRSQMECPSVKAIIDQVRGLPVPKLVKPIEAMSCRLSPVDDVLERKVVLSGVCLWVPYIPDWPVPTEAEWVSWQKWLYLFVHETFMNPHRAVGENFQLLCRMGYWDSLAPDFNKWYTACLACHRNRARSVHPPMRSITADDSMREKLPWSNVIVDVQGPYTQAEGLREVPPKLPLLRVKGAQVGGIQESSGRPVFSGFGCVCHARPDHPRRCSHGPRSGDDEQG